MAGTDDAERLAGAVLGHLVGDALGVPYEFQPAEQIGRVEFRGGGIHGQPAGTWSDDGALMLALLDSLLAVGFDPEDQAKRFLAWADDGAYTPDGEGCFDIGGTTAAALSRIRRGTPAEQAGGTDERSNGNGSLMRILPLALVDADDPSLAELVDRAHRSSRITHGHPIAQVTCALYVLVARRLMQGERGRPGVLEQSRAELRPHYESLGEEGRAYRDALSTLEGWTDRSGRGYVIDSFWSAWDAFAGADSYRETIERAIAYGNDTDTTACIAGGLAGIHWGLDAIPRDWLAGLRGREVVGPLVEGLLARHGWDTSSANPIRVDWIDVARVPALSGSTGRLGMTFLPGKRGATGQAGGPWRDAVADAVELRSVGVDTLLLLVEDHELERAGTAQVEAALKDAGIELVRHPIEDMGVPDDPPAFRQRLEWVRDHVGEGRAVAVACMGGLGRTGTAVGCLLVDYGLSAEEAIRLTRETRRGTIEAAEQVQFVRDWESGG